VVSSCLEMALKSFSEILTPENVAVGVMAEDRREVIAILVDLLQLESEELKREIRESVRRREEIQTTGIGLGIAIPHGKGPIDAPILGSVVIAADGVDYGSVDGNPVRIFILMVSRPDVAGPHVQALAHVARLLGHRQFREALMACGTPEEAVALIKESETE
jgi:mannitol/fructose-specific phosphotransferase system IIA component (Ntr-type)